MPTFLIGDIHGHYTPMIDLLRDDIQVIRDDLTWCGGDATVCIVGDYVDRGPDGIKVLDFLISLEIQTQFNDSGGKIICLQGNHDHVLLSAKRFPDDQVADMDMTFYENWLDNGGVQRDLDSLTPEHIAWLSHLPAMVHLGDCVVVHGDAMLYLDYGQTADAVNRAFTQVLMSYDPGQWYDLLAAFNEHQAFWDAPENADTFIEVYGGKRIIHGHTPIMKITGQEPDTVTKALIYNDGKCINVDGGIYRGGPGFVYEL